MLPLPVGQVSAAVVSRRALLVPVALHTTCLLSSESLSCFVLFLCPQRAHPSCRRYSTAQLPRTFAGQVSAAVVSRRALLVPVVLHTTCLLSSESLSCLVSFLCPRRALPSRCHHSIVQLQRSSVGQVSAAVVPRWALLVSINLHITRLPSPQTFS